MARRKYGVTDQQIIDLYRELNGGNEVARRLRVHERTVYAVLAAAGIERDGQAKRRLFQMRAEIENVVEAYKGGAPATGIATRYGCSVGAILDLLRRERVPLRGSKERLTARDKAEIKRLYESGMQFREVAKQSGKHFNTVRLLLNKEHPEIIRSKIVGPGGPRWKGGRSMHHGYIYVWIAADDPMSEMAHKSGYVAEHRLVMARKLGRPLRPTETVHHIDGDKANNKPSNLQLRQGRHGKHVAMCCLACGSFNIGHAPI
jgi:hypothetical protein